MAKLKLAVIGKDVSKSLSPQMHNFIAEHIGNDIEYEKISVAEHEFEDTADKILREYDGFNVTIPYKLKIMKKLNSVSGDAKVFGAVNCVLSKDKSGYNTDGQGFMLMLKNEDISVCGKRVLVLGAGGAGRSVSKKLYDEGASVFVYDRRYENAKAVAQEFNLTALREIKPESYFLIVNATGVGMHDTEGISPVGLDLLNLCEVAVDLIYTPKKSKFLSLAEKCGKKIINGEAMLFYQAYFAECIYFNTEPDFVQAKLLFDKFREETL